MNKETTLQDYINYLIKSVCSKCNYYNKAMGVCGGEILPIERAVFRNLDGRGTCSDIKEIAEILWEDKEHK